MAALPPCRAKAPEPKPMPSCKVLSSATACSHSPFGEIVLRSTPPPAFRGPKTVPFCEGKRHRDKIALVPLARAKAFQYLCPGIKVACWPSRTEIPDARLAPTDEVQGDKLALTTQTAMPRLPGEVHEPGNKDSWHSDDVDSMHPRAPDASHLPRRRMVFVLVHTWSALPLHCLRKPKMPSFCEQGMMMLWPGIG